MLTVTFVEFLVLTSVVWEPWEEKQELQLVDVTDKQVGQVLVQVLEHTWQHKQTKRGVHVDVTLTGQQEAEHLELLVIVITGRSVVLVDLDKVVQE